MINSDDITQDATQSRHTSSFRWVMIGLCFMTAMLAHAIPTMSLPVLFDQIAAELSISVVQIGVIWGTISFTGMFVGLLGGMLGDRFGSKRVLVFGCMMVGLLGATRGLAIGFYSFLFSSFCLGLFVPMIGVNLHKTASEWFEESQLGQANGIIAAGFASGFLVGSFSASRLFAPLFGGWRNLLFVYGGVAFAIGLVWLFVAPADTDRGNAVEGASFFANIGKVIRLRSVLILGLGKMGIWGCLRGFTGYLPLYLKGVGWSPNQADMALSVFFLLSLIGVMPLSILSDKLGKRKPFLYAAGLFVGTAVFSIGLTTSPLIFVFVALGGLFFDAFMTIMITKVSELKGVEAGLTGTALGVVFIMADFSATLTPIIGNWLAQFGANLPFFFWGSLALLGLVAFTQLEGE